MRGSSTFQVVSFQDEGFKSIRTGESKIISNVELGYYKRKTADRFSGFSSLNTTLSRYDVDGTEIRSTVRGEALTRPGMPRY